MAKISYWQFPEEWLPLINRILAWNDRFFFVSLRRKPGAYSVRRKKIVTQNSLLPQISEAWNNLQQSAKDEWATAAEVDAQRSFRLFVQEFAQSYQYQLDPPQLPSLFAQNNVGRCVISFPAAGFLLKQEHPFEYEIVRNVTGKRSMQYIETVREWLSFPFIIGISWKTNLEPVGTDPFAGFYVEVLSHYQGRDIYTPTYITFGASDEWQRTEIEVQRPIGLIKGYTAYIDVNGYQGELDFDNVLLQHSGQNWARDFRCNNIQTNYTRAFQQVARNWESVIAPSGFLYGSVYWRL